MFISKIYKSQPMNTIIFSKQDNFKKITKADILSSVLSRFSKVSDISSMSSQSKNN